MAVSALATDLESDLLARIEELEERLDRERARNAGLEQGIDALTRRVDELRRENERLRTDR